MWMWRERLVGGGETALGGRTQAPRWRGRRAYITNNPRHVDGEKEDAERS